MNKEIYLLKVGRWHTPKSQSILNTNYNYICTGCYDALDIKEIKSNEFEAAYDNINQDRLDDSFIDLYTDRRIVIFRDKNENHFSYDSKKKLFVSLVSVENIYIDSVCSKIKTIFEQTGYSKNYAIFFSFDYSDLVILAQDISIEAFNQIITMMNYTGEFGHVHDTVTLYCIPTDEAKKLNSLIMSNKDNLPSECIAKNEYKPNFYADFHLDINDDSVVKEITKEFEKANYLFNFSSLTFGRMDYILNIGFENEIHFLYSLLIIDKYSCEKHTNRISSCEFVIWPSEHTKKHNCNFREYDLDAQKKLKDFFENLYNKFLDSYNEFIEKKDCKVSAYWDEESLKTIIVETINSFLAFYKNGVAEEFLLCVCDPIVSFLRYSIGFFEGKRDNTEIKQYGKFVEEFYGYLQQLTYTTVHSNRKFLQVNVFNSAYFDVPPKLLALFASWAKEVAQEIGAEKYTFLFVPTLSNSIFLKCISPQTKSNNIVTINVGEKILYNPLKFKKLLYHEIAHYVGTPDNEDIRKRALRKEYLIKIYLFFVLEYIFGKKSNAFIEGLINRLYAIISEIGQYDDLYVVNARNQTCDLEILFNSLPGKLSEPIVTKLFKESLDSFFNEYFLQVQSNEDITNEFKWFLRELRKIHGSDVFEMFTSDNFKHKEQLKEFIKPFFKGYIFDAFCSCVDTLNFDFSKRNELKSKIKGIMYIFKEGFSDINMTIYMDMKKEDYISLVPNSKINIEANRVIGVNECMVKINGWEPNTHTFDSFPYKLYVAYLSECAVGIQNRKKQNTKSKNKHNLFDFQDSYETYKYVTEIANKSLSDTIKSLLEGNTQPI